MLSDAEAFQRLKNILVRIGMAQDDDENEHVVKMCLAIIIGPEKNDQDPADTKTYKTVDVTQITRHLISKGISSQLAKTEADVLRNTLQRCVKDLDKLVRII